MFLLVPAYPGCPGSKAVKRSLLLLLLLLYNDALANNHRVLSPLPPLPLPQLLMLLPMLRRRVAQPIDQSRNSSRDKTISRPSLVVA